jgi:hypothetical protein
MRKKKMKQFVAILVSGALLAALPSQGGEKGTVVEIDDGLKSTAPAHWVMQKPENKFRAWQFAIPPAEGDAKGADLVIYYFGSGAVGTAQANIDRWKSQFRAPEGKTIDQASKVTEMKVGQTPVTYLDIHGTYLFKSPPFDPNAKVMPLEGYRQLAVVFDSKKGPYFMKLTGPAKTVTANKKAFDDWLAGFK